VRGNHFKNDYDAYQTGFQLWWDGVGTVDYNNLENDHILRLAIARGLSSETDTGELGALATIEEIVEMLYIEDYDNFANQTIGARNPVIGVTRLDAYKRPEQSVRRTWLYE
jgi:hypothetical protein